MNPRNDIREFLISRRAKITPEQAGLPVYGRNRRVTGLRREEVAMLAGVSVEYYTRLERGNAAGVSEDVLDGVVRALQLDEAERAHLFDLARAANTAPPPRRRPTHDVARFIFLNPKATEFFDRWDDIANDAVAILRSEAGRDPHDRRLSDLIGELSTRSETFRVRWAAHNVKFHRTGTKTLHHPLVGALTLDYEALELAGDTGQRILVYSAEPGSQSDESLRLLASWTTTPSALEIPDPATDR